ncbi:hypothetical protein ACSFCK_09840 [Brevibacterium luteolum]
MGLPAAGSTAAGSTADGQPPRHQRQPLPRGRGRNWFSKRWIYWKRRYSNPTRRDWVLLASLIWIVLSAAAALLSFRLGGLTLAAGLFLLAGLRMLPGPLGEMWVNRPRRADVITILILAGALAGLSLVVPGH